MPISRRQFLESAAAASFAAEVVYGAQADKKTGIPMRIFGKTGARIPCITFGCGSRFLMYKQEDKALEAVNRAIDLGITYLDTAFSYGNGQSEERLGKVMKTRRKEVWLTTKINKRTYDEGMSIIEGSLKRLQTDRIDLIHVHSLTDMDDLKAVESGLLKALYKARDQKMTRFIGVTSHTDPTVLKLALERHDFDCTQMALNAARVGMKSGKGGMEVNEAMKESFELTALPAALKKKMGVTAMKIFGQEALVGKASVEKLIRYALSLPVAAATLGMPKLEFLEENVKIAKAFKPLPKNEMHSLATQLLPQKAMMDRFFATHIDA
ncbi:MAG: aldo/keto reductase [Candidatus Solibacter usitatus]|nr:aldo/keto reductase [Candidatus Solibacter usitatus]